MTRRLSLSFIAIVCVLSAAPLIGAEPDNPTITIDRSELSPDPASGVFAVRTPVPPPPTTIDGRQPPPVVGLRDIAAEMAKWSLSGQAAGNVGDLYDNRDRGHSMLRLQHFPQITRLVYSPALKQRNLDYALQGPFIYDRPTIGNSSTALTGPAWRSNPRRAYVDPRLMKVLAQQYIRNQLYVYPEHRDYDPGHDHLDGGGYGDVFSANTPYLLISQGSSGSDQDFLEALIPTLAAFRPDVKQSLIQHGLLMPTVQMIFRHCYADVHTDADYRSGKANPPVFDGKLIHRRAMIEMAHAMTADTIPPLAQISVVEEDNSKLGVDYFEAGPGVDLVTTPQSVARMHRTVRRDYHIVLSAGGSTDANQRPLTYHWVVLEGDAKAIRIQPLDQTGKVVQIDVPWQGRHPIAMGSEMQTNRIDIGLFVNNGVYDSAPAFFSVNDLDDETRVYDEAGRIFEVDYDAGQMHLDARDWPLLIRSMAEHHGDAFAALLNDDFTDAQRATLTKIATEYDAAAKAQQAAQQAYEKMKKAGGNSAEARNRRQQAEAERDRTRTAAAKLLDDSVASLGGSVKDVILWRINRVLHDPLWFTTHAATIMQLRDAKGKIGPVVNPLVRIGLLHEADDHGAANNAKATNAYTIVSVRSGDTPVQTRLTPYERRRLMQLNAAVVQLLLQRAVNVGLVSNYVDPFIATHRRWRDVYHYDAAGHRLGWTRYHADGSVDDFTADGARVIDRDAQHRPLHARTVQYTLAPTKAKQFARRTLQQTDGPTLLTYAYTGDDDRVGHIASQKPAE